MVTHNYYEDWRFCSACRTYVRFLLSPHAAYCVECGGNVRLFSQGDMERFRRKVSSKPVALVLDSASNPRSRWTG